MPGTTTKSFRLPDDLLERLDAYKARLEAQAGVRLTDTQAIVSLLRRALDLAEAEEAAPRKPSKPRR